MTLVGAGRGASTRRRRASTLGPAAATKRPAASSGCSTPAMTSDIAPPRGRPHRRRRARQGQAGGRLQLPAPATARSPPRRSRFPTRARSCSRSTSRPRQAERLSRSSAGDKNGKNVEVAALELHHRAGRDVVRPAAVAHHRGGDGARLRARSTSSAALPLPARPHLPPLQHRGGDQKAIARACLKIPLVQGEFERAHLCRVNRLVGDSRRSIEDQPSPFDSEIEVTPRARSRRPALGAGAGRLHPAGVRAGGAPVGARGVSGGARVGPEGDPRPPWRRCAPRRFRHGLTRSIEMLSQVDQGIGEVEARHRGRQGVETPTAAQKAKARACWRWNATLEECEVESKWPELEEEARNAVTVAGALGCRSTARPQETAAARRIVGRRGGGARARAAGGRAAAAGAPRFGSCAPAAYFRAPRRVEHRARIGGRLKRNRAKGPEALSASWSTTAGAPRERRRQRHGEVGHRAALAVVAGSTPARCARTTARGCADDARRAGRRQPVSTCWG